MTGVGDDSRGRLAGRPWLVVGLLLAVGATLALVLSDDARFLRLGIVAALWAALVGAFLAVRYRKHASSTEESVAQAQAVYELELEREIAARREYELEIEADTRDRVEADSREELDALRAELTALRESLQSLFGGEVLYERVALTAQATRMRSLQEQRVVQAAGGSNGKPKPAQLAAGTKKPEPVEHPTDLIERVLEQGSAAEHRRKAGAQQAQKAPKAPNTAQPKSPEPRRTEPRRPEPPVEDGPPTRRVSAEQAAAASAMAAKALGQTRNETTRVHKPAKPPVPPKPPTPPTPQPAARAEPPRRPEQRPRLEPTQPSMEPLDRGRPAAGLNPPPAKPAPKPEPAAPAKPQVDAPTEVAKGLDLDRKSSWENRERPVNDLSAAFPSRPRGGTYDRLPPVAANGNGRRPTEPERKPGPNEETRIATPQPAPQPQPAPEPLPPSRHGVHRSAAAEQPATPPAAEPQQNNPTLPESVRQIQEQGRPGGRRRRADDEPSAPVTPPAPEQPETSGGRRRRPDGEPPSWQSIAEREEAARGSRHSSPANGQSATGSHARPDASGAAEPGRNGANGHRSAAAHTEPESGSHTAGRSVSELLAAHGSTDSTPRRRRRAED
ncbi:DUF6779 domain-containing protein [Amycolatopsis nigrescens]|uniref:DUF6779 domain-containing protein n=1 Tax=Amycolatopsis nigrescens TaxID=381445 RepID=UPI000475D26C|nr:DUF6779 domain-containing protein [Amycolatopsis nigrescens]